MQVCIDCTLSPFVRRATRGTVAVQMFVAGALVVRKWLVAPESRIAQSLDGYGVGGDYFEEHLCCKSIVVSGGWEAAIKNNVVVRFTAIDTRP